MDENKSTRQILMEVRESQIRTEERLRSGDATLADHETRIRSNEKQIWWASGFGGALGFIFTKLFR